MIFVDADAYIGLFVEKDANHSRAVKILGELDEEELVTSWDVIDEVATKLSFFAGRKTAIEFIKIVTNSTTKIEFVDELIKMRAIEIFCKQVSKRVSMTDCVNMAIAKKKSIKRFFSFDRHYKQNGFELI